MLNHLSTNQQDQLVFQNLETFLVVYQMFRSTKARKINLLA